MYNTKFLSISNLSRYLPTGLADISHEQQITVKRQMTPQVPTKANDTVLRFLLTIFRGVEGQLDAKTELDAKLTRKL